MRWFQKYGVAICMAVLLFFFCTFTAYAADKPAVVETFTGENEAVIYLKGIRGKLTDVIVQIDTMVCESVSQSRLSETGQPVKTLIMLEHSKSVRTADRKQIYKLMKEIIEAKMDNEQMAAAVLNEGLEYLADYTSDESALLKALEGITYQKSNTNLTDVLYDLLSEEYVKNTEDVFFRIIVISDGAVHKKFGDAKDGLEDLLKERPIPIYTAGLDRDRQTLQKIIKSLGQAQNIVRLAAVVPDELMDGSKKTVKITFASGKSVSQEIVMPKPIKTSVKKPVLGNADASGDEKNEEPVSGGAQQEENSIWKAASVIALVLAVIAVLAAVFGVIKRFGKKSKREQNYYSRQGSVSGIRQRSAIVHSRDGITAHEQDMESIQETEWMSDETQIDQTQIMETAYYIMLTDINTASVSFRVPLSDSVIVGRAGSCGIVIDYDKSISNRHCKIAVQDGRFYITDLNSSNGTFVDGRQVQTKAEIVSGSHLKLGRLTFRFESELLDDSNTLQLFEN